MLACANKDRKIPQRAPPVNSGAARDPMSARTTSHFSTTLLGLALAAAAIVADGRPACGQSDSIPAARATLRGWEEEVRHAVFDRGGSYAGRTSDSGILQQFNEKMDAEYGLDVISSRFSLVETYDWYLRDSGARFWAGSIDHLRLVQQGEFKARVGLGASWSARAGFRYEETLTARRSLATLGLGTSLADGRARVELVGTLEAEKPETDLELAAAWATGPLTVTLALGALDVFSDFIYRTLEVDPGVADSALDYTAHPFTARVAVDAPLGRSLRAEAYGLALTPARVVVESQTSPGVGFAQDERYAYAGGLIAWEPTSQASAGIFATWVRARLEREPLAAGRPEDAFALTEATRQLGAYAILVSRGPLAAEAWLARVWRSEERMRPDTTVAPNVDYEDRTWAGRASLAYRTATGPFAELGLDLTARETRGAAPVATLEPLAADNVRLRFDLGWRFGGRALFIAGGNVDLDHGGFDGAHGRFALFW
jgi:hypothetical protein